MYGSGGVKLRALLAKTRGNCTVRVTKFLEVRAQFGEIAYRENRAVYFYEMIALSRLCPLPAATGSPALSRTIRRDGSRNIRAM